MRFLIAISIILFFNRCTTELPSVSHSPKDSLISLLPKMKSTDLGCDADIYWKIIKRGSSSIPALIESLTDSTPTNVYDKCKKGNLNVGEISYFALDEIMFMPVAAITQSQWCTFDSNGCWIFYEALFDNGYKVYFQEQMRNFYYREKFNYEYYSEKELNDCRKKYKIAGRLAWIHSRTYPIENTDTIEIINLLHKISN